MGNVLKITSLKETAKPIDNYWLTKTYQERMHGLEIMRIHAFTMRDNGQYISSRLQRVCRITQR